MTHKHSFFILFFAAAIKPVALNFTSFDLFGDEAQYLLWSQNLDLEQFGISSLKNYDPMKIRDEVNKELLDLSEAHHQRYFQKA